MDTTGPSSKGPFDWYCGENSSDNLIDFTFDLNHTLYNACFTDLVYTLPHLVFIVMATVVLLILGCCTKIRMETNTYLVQFPCHNARWVFNFLLISITLCELGEGILTDLDVYHASPTSKPHLYVPAGLSLIAAILTMIYYNQAELWSKPSMSWLLLLYWVSALGVEVVRLLNLYHDEQVDLTLLRYDLCITAIAMYSIYLILEVYVVITKVFKCCHKEDEFPEDLKKPDMYYMQGYTSLLSSSFYWWLNWIFKKGYKTALELSDLGSLSEVHTTQYQRDVFTAALEKEQARAKAKRKPLSLFRVFVRAFGYRMLIGGFVKLAGDVATFVPPLALAGAINYVTDVYYGGGLQDYGITKYISASDFLRNGFVLVVIMFWVTIIKLLGQQGHYHIVITESGHIKSALQAAIYDKSLRLSSYTISGGAMTMGQITNHMSVDTNNVLNSMQWVHYVWSIPFVIIGYMVILYFELGVAALIGCIVFFITIPVQVLIAKKTAQYQKRVMMKSDDRLKRTNEVLQGIKLIKLYGWEDMFYDAISKVRAAEILTMMKQLGYNVALRTIVNASPLLVTIVSYSLYTLLTGFALTPAIAFASLSVFNQMVTPLFIMPNVLVYHVNAVSYSLYTLLTGFALTPAIAFASLSVFNQMVTPLFIMPNVLVYHVNAVVSTARLRAFFEASEIEKQEEEQGGQRETNKKDEPLSGRKRSKSQDRYRLLSNDGVTDPRNGYGTLEGTLPPSVVPQVPDAIAVRVNGSFTWDSSAKCPTLENINLEIPAGKLTMVVGQVGSGKSSLLSALLGEMTTVTGTVQWNRKHSLVAYGAQKAWLLNASLKENILFGNKYESERYKKVVAACSLQPDIDILPAGDLTEIGEKGINLSGGQKQRVSVARAMYSDIDIVILDDPLSALDMHVGSHLFKKGIEGFLMRKSKRTVVLVTHQIQYVEKADRVVYMKDGRILHQGTVEEIQEENYELVASWKATLKMITESESEMDSSDTGMDATEERAKLKRQVSKQLEEAKRQEEEDRASSSAGRLVQKEERAEGSVSWRVYFSYIKALGIWSFILIFILFVAQSGLGVATNFWLSDWSEAGANMTNATQAELQELLRYYLIGYAGLSVGSVVAGALAIAWLYVVSLFAARKLHNSMLGTVMHAPLRFFDTTPIGRILNRFSSDTAVIDQKLGLTMSSFVRFTLNCLSALLVNIIVVWFFAIALIPIVILYLLLMVVFIQTSRELQRLDSISKSPVYAHFSESLGGLSTIRAYRQQHRFQESIIKKIECSNITFLYLNTGNRWLGSKLDLIGAIIVLVAGLTTMITALSGSLAPSLVGLSITYALNVSTQLNWVIRMSADMEMQMNAMERVEYYRAIETEKYNGTQDPGPDWPDKGDVTFDSISARYASHLDAVLHDISIHFRAGEKIGICGRTGSGKSSLTLTLFRIIQTFQGNIIVDGVNIAHLPLVEVRRRLAIIPQDPVLFTGTIRFNLDARSEHEDGALWEALEIAQLKDVVCELDLGLDAMVTEGGENFSVGQRQLFCLARAFLRKTRILVMDEATASIDLETDAILQQVVATAFKDRTVITIAHRVQTILDSDHILVLSEGRIAEYDTPQNLLAQDDSIFSSLVKAGT